MHEAKQSSAHASLGVFLSLHPKMYMYMNDMKSTINGKLIQAINNKHDIILIVGFCERSCVTYKILQNYATIISSH